MIKEYRVHINGPDGWELKISSETVPVGYEWEFSFLEATGKEYCRIGNTMCDIRIR